MTDAPRRIQLRRSAGWRKPAGAIVVSRPSSWGNPFRIGDPYRFVDKDGQLMTGVTHSRAEAVDLFRQFLAARPDLQKKIRDELAGHDLCCWCPPGEPCHADVLLNVARGEQL